MLAAVLSTLAAWIVGLVLDANVGFEPFGFLCLRVVLPVIVMGAFILTAINSQKKDNEISEKEKRN